MKPTFSRKAQTYDGAAKVQKRYAKRLFDSLSPYLRGNDLSAVEIGAGTGLLTEKLLTSRHFSRLIVNDISQEMLEVCKNKLERWKNKDIVEYVVCDAETMKLTQTVDLVASASAVQWLSDPFWILRFAQDILNLGGLLAVLTYGPSTFIEIDDLTGVGLHYPSDDEWAEQFNGFEILVYESRHVTIYFDSALDVLRHISRTGANMPSELQFTKSDLKLFEASYDSYRHPGQSFPLTYNPFWFVARKL